MSRRFTDYLILDTRAYLDPEAADILEACSEADVASSARDWIGQGIVAGLTEDGETVVLGDCAAFVAMRGAD